MPNASVSFTPEALELWFEKLTLDWETSFSVEELLQGREIYHSGEISSLDLDTSEAMVSRRIEIRRHPRQENTSCQQQ